jgi:anti-sigma factor RsiW
VVCDDNARLLHGYLDGELDLVRSLEIEEHLKSCPDCAQELWNQRTLRKAFRAASVYDRAPAGLAERIRAGVVAQQDKSAQQEASAGASAGVAGPVEEREAPKKAPVQPIRVVTSKRSAWNWLAVAAAILITFAVSWRVAPELNQRRNADMRAGVQADVLTEEILSSHIRSLQPDHLYDVRSTDQHTVKPWFNGRLDFSPTVRDLSEDGYPLVGGRLDYVDHRAVAALVYQRRQHLINVFVWPEAKGNEVAMQTKSVQGYNMVPWEGEGMYHCAVSDLNKGELEQFTELLRK